MPELSILIPVHNERSTIEQVIESILAVDFGVEGIELLVIDDGSDDGTRELLLEREWPPEVHTFFHQHNKGKGAALQTGLSHASGTWSVIQDADLEYDPSDIPQLLQPLISDKAKVVFGTRSFSSHAAFSFWYVIGNKAVTFATNVLYNSWISDLMTCHKVASTELLRSLQLREQGFAIEAEITAKLLQAGARIYEIPVDYQARSREEGKHLTAVDGLRVLRTLLRCRFERSALELG